MKYLKAILTLLICSAALFGDYVVFKSKLSESQTFRALADSATHASIGFLSSILFFSHDLNVTNQTYLFNVIFCTILSALIDIDHVFLAKSFNLKDLTSLKQRGIFHCTSFWIAITTCLLIYSYIMKTANIYMLTYMVVLAYMSHHIRDANRRGLWIYPFGHTMAFNKYLYIFLTIVIPHICALIYKNTNSNFVSYVSVDYSSII